jgi:hypothetical protein
VTKTRSPAVSKRSVSETTVLGIIPTIRTTGVDASRSPRRPAGAYWTHTRGTSRTDWPSTIREGDRGDAAHPGQATTSRCRPGPRSRSLPAGRPSNSGARSRCANQAPVIIAVADPSLAVAGHLLLPGDGRARAGDRPRVRRAVPRDDRPPPRRRCTKWRLRGLAMAGKWNLLASGPTFPPELDSLTPDDTGNPGGAGAS